MRLICLTLCWFASSALAADDDVPSGWFESGWPAALADAACDDDEACLAKLRACGPEDDCAAGVSYCSLTRAGQHIYESACQTDRDGNSVNAHVPSRTVFEMTFGDDARLDGAAASSLEEHCLHREDTQETFCARPIDQRHTLRAWVKED